MIDTIGPAIVAVRQRSFAPMVIDYWLNQGKGGNKSPLDPLAFLIGFSASGTLQKIEVDGSAACMERVSTLLLLAELLMSLI